MKAAGIRYRDFDGEGCPFRGPLYQLMRLHLLAHWLETNTQNAVDVAVGCFKGNTALMCCPRYLKHLVHTVPEAWRSLLAEPERFRVLFADDLMAHCDSLPDVADSEWRTYLKARYGV